MAFLPCHLYYGPRHPPLQRAELGSRGGVVQPLDVSTSVRPLAPSPGPGLTPPQV